MSVAPPPVPTFQLGVIDAPHVIDTILGIELAAAVGAPSVTVIIDSPGGFVNVGYVVIGTMQRARAQGTRVDCRVEGMAASMAAIVLEAGCSTRTMSRSSSLMFHEIYVGKVNGPQTIYTLRTTANGLEDDNRRSAVMIAWRMGMTAGEYLRWIAGRDRWVDAAEALELGFIDAVR